MVQTTTDLIYHVEHSLLPALGEALSRSVRILDFLDGAELAYRRGQFEVVAPFPARNPFKTGEKDWVEELKLKTERLGHGFWSDFRPATEDQLRYNENRIGRKLDPEFCEFYHTVGFRSFRDKLRYAGCIYSPEEIAACIACPIYFITGSMTQGARMGFATRARRALALPRAQEPKSEGVHRGRTHTRGRQTV